MTSPKPFGRRRSPSSSGFLGNRGGCSLSKLLGWAAGLCVFAWLLFTRVPSYKRPFAQLSSLSCPFSKGTVQYAIVLDAGSTGSRTHVYRFNRCSSTPVLEDEVFLQIKPGLSSFESDPTKASESLQPLMDIALQSVPPELQSSTPLTLKATAGLRMLPDNKGELILGHVRAYLKAFPFQVDDKTVEIMDGKDEGVYAWITVNYLLGNLESKEKASKKKQTAAIMDLGGGSTQIVFEPKSEFPEGPHKVTVPFLGHNYSLYQKSYDGYGLKQGLKKSTSKGGCSAKPVATCATLLSSLFDKGQTCSLSPCSFDGVYMPRLEDHFYDGDIYAFSYFYDVYAEPFDRVETGFKVGHIHEAFTTTCAAKSEHEDCLSLGFIYSLLKVGYDLPHSRHLKTAKKINGIETGWCLGAALAMLH